MYFPSVDVFWCLILFAATIIIQYCSSSSCKKDDISFVNIAHIENGNVATSDKILKQLAKALDYDVDKMLATADSVNEDIKKIIKKLPTAVPEFLRTAKNLTEDEWKDLTEQVKKKKK